jgi:hypothetical protein
VRLFNRGCRRTRGDERHFNRVRDPRRSHRPWARGHSAPAGWQHYWAHRGTDRPHPEPEPMPDNGAGLVRAGGLLRR